MSNGDHPTVERDGATVSVATAAGRLEITVCTPRIVRMRMAPPTRSAPDDQPARSSYLAPRSWPPQDYTLRTGERAVIETSALRVEIDTRLSDLTFGDANGNVLLRWRVAASNPEAGVARFAPQGEQHFYGLGEGGGPFDRLGTARQLWNSHVGPGPGSDIGVPLLLSHRGYGLFWDDTGDASIVIGRSDEHTEIVYRGTPGDLDCYYLAGGDMRGLLGEVAELLGHAPLPPRWALGFQQSTRHFADTDELRALPRTLREKRIPCDAVIFLSTYGDALGWNRGVGHLEFQPDLWSAPADLLSEMRAQHFQVITHEYPVLHEESPLFSEAVQQGYILAEGYDRITPESRPTTNFQEGQRYIDFSDPGARAWWWERHRQLVELGVAGWWLDGGEGPPSTTALRGGEGRALHNLYDRLRQQAFADGEARDVPDRRTFLLCRSGAAGMQREGAACWSGDINNTFATLEAQIPLGLNTALSGIPYWGTDIGGFFHPIPESGSLYARWFQFGAFCPIFRAHGWVWREHVPWAHGPEVEEICRRYAELRYRLLPYTYTLAWQAHTTGLPLMRPLVLNYPDDPRVRDLGSEYLWGDDLLVAPVTREGATSWPVYLPAGVWYDFWTQRRYDGPCGVTVDAPLDRLPLFARAGAILPLGPVVQYEDERPTDELTLLVYPGPGGASRFVLYEDDGRSNAYRRGRYALTSVECTSGHETIRLTIGAPSGDASLVPAGRSYVLQLLASRPQRVMIEGRGELPPRADGPDAAPSSSWWHDGERFTYVRLPASPGAIDVIIEL